jgi:hypothetical protein
MNILSAEWKKANTSGSYILKSSFTPGLSQICTNLFGDRATFFNYSVLSPIPTDSFVPQTKLMSEVLPAEIFPINTWCD